MGKSRPCGERSRRARAAEGFTFIEILVSMLILSILIGASGFTYLRYVARARIVAAQSDIRTYALALSSYYLDGGRYPSTEQGLAALWEKPILEPLPVRWEGPYTTRRITRDPWGHDYQYAAPGPNGLPFGIRSLGADGREGGEGDDQDLVSWEG